jgi:hypothetical protein
VPHRSSPRSRVSHVLYPTKAKQTLLPAVAEADRNLNGCVAEPRRLLELHSRRCQGCAPKRLQSPRALKASAGHRSRLAIRLAGAAAAFGASPVADRSESMAAPLPSRSPAAAGVRSARQGSPGGCAELRAGGRLGHHRRAAGGAITLREGVSAGRVDAARRTHEAVRRAELSSGQCATVYVEDGASDLTSQPLQQPIALRRQ